MLWQCPLGFGAEPLCLFDLGRKGWEVLQHPEMAPEQSLPSPSKWLGASLGLGTAGGDNHSVSVPLPCWGAVPGMCGSAFSLPVWASLWQRGLPLTGLSLPELL